ncbi:hypothetical protein JDV02_002185 [Purpureocillium takamizusanense]|uniref:SET domain-containing protein n=1 Tax=Purpureocillium takamizusanense TaxID=2060973 RepID=A0A9Q8QAW2_9HYPO|nr:uncharacterized protein JDV02_002185 [Purpureocillium takamizusanense]UNI15674.1 hypothetical protein JDV02_002185 [Purpureocillium takamizusanense]
MDAIDSLLRRADEDGVKVFGVTPTVLPGRGIGMVATRDLDKGDVIMNIPVQAIRSLHTVPEDISRRLSRDMSIHGLLAAELALRRGAAADWASIAPQWTDFEATMPMLWPEELQSVLPAEAKSLLTKQCSRFEIDWKMFSDGFPDQLRRDYLYAWLLVNTRTFYFETPSMVAFPWHDRLALLPVADLFNHADTGCSVSFSTEAYDITADRPYCAGDEILTSYGEHSNDFLLAEYGFVLRENQHDKLCLDDVILPRLTPGQKSELKGHGYLGDFMLHAGSKRSDNIWVALRLLSCVNADWQSYVDGEEDEDGTLEKAAEQLPHLFEEYLCRSEETLGFIRALQVGKACQRNLLVQRWEQIQAIIRQWVEDQASAE